MLISVAVLIYKSTRYADFVYDSFQKHIGNIKYDVEFYFVANDATEHVKQHLRAKGYPFYVNDNPHRTEAELFEMGFAWPEYIHRVYRGWNKAIEHAKGDVIVLINSDMSFSPGWLDNLVDKLEPGLWVSSKLIERGHETIGHFSDSLNGTGSFLQSFGSHPDNFDEDAFLKFAESFKRDQITNGGVYMPCAFYKKDALDVGMYPEGNIAGSSFYDVVDYGDRVFERKLAQKGVRHVTTWNSVVYHFQQGEMEE